MDADSLGLLGINNMDGDDEGTPSTFRWTESDLGSLQDILYADEEQPIERKVSCEVLGATNEGRKTSGRWTNLADICKRVQKRPSFNEGVGILQALANDDSNKVSEHITSFFAEGIKFGSDRLTALLIASVNCGVQVNKALLDGGVDPNERDAIGRLPLLAAAACGKFDVLKLLLKGGADPNAALECCGDSRDSTAVEDEIWFKKEDELMEAKNLKIPTLQGEGRSALHFAAKANSSACVKLLLAYKVNPDSRDVCGITPVMLAGEEINSGDPNAINEYEEIMRYLVDGGADIKNNFEKLHENRPQSTICMPPLHRAAELESSKTLRLLLENGVNPNWSCEGLDWNTALQIAAEKAANSAFPAPDCFSVLLSYGADLCYENENEVTPLETVLGQILRPIKYFNSVLDDQVTLFGETKDKCCAVSVNFKAMCPEGEDGQEKILHALMEGENISKWMRYEIFRHPLTRAFVTAKWDGLKYFFYVYLSAYVIHVICLSLFATFAHCDLFRIFDRKYSQAMLHSGIPVARILVILTAIMVLVNVAAMCYVFPRRYPFRFEMMRSVVSSILSVTVSILTEYDGNVLGKGVDEVENEKVLWVMERLTETQRTTPTNEVENFMETIPLVDQTIILHCTSIAIFLSWLELMLLVGRFSWAADALLYTAVLKNVLRVLVTYGFMVVGFAFVFFLEFRNADNRAFGDPWRSLVKTVVMMMGEFDYMNIFSGNSDDNKVWEKSTLPWFSRLIFLGFVILASIALMNLMLGLAVSDTQDLADESSERQLMKVAECVIHWEFVVYALESLFCFSNRLKGYLNRMRTVPTLYRFPLSLRKSPFPRDITKNLAMIALKNREEGSKRRSPEEHDLQSILLRSPAPKPPQNFSPQRQLSAVPEDLAGILDCVRREVAELRREVAEIKEVVEHRFNTNKQVPWHHSQFQSKTGRKKLNQVDRRSMKSRRGHLNGSPA